MRAKHIQIILIIILFSKSLFAESFGLQFFAHEEQLDKRTGLNLNPDKQYKIKENFTLNFELAFDRNQIIHFGYILRIIANDTLNLDLICDDNNGTISLIEGKSGNMITAPIQIKEFADFEVLTIDFNKANNQVSLVFNDSTYILKTTSFNDVNLWQYFFGINHSKLFKTTDVPSMQIRNVSLIIDEQKMHEWPLNNQAGNWIKDEIGNQDAYVENPFWLYNLHDNWILEKELTFNSYTQFVQKNNSDTLFFLSCDSLLTYHLSQPDNNTSRSLSRRINLPNGSKIVYNPLSNEIIYYSIDDHLISHLNISNLIPSNKIITKKRLTGYWQHNRFLNLADTSLIISGGYGYLTYKNEITTVNLSTGKWDSYFPDNQILYPHYLSAIGANTNKDTLYIFGGYGSQTGDQKINPGYIYNLNRYVPKTKKIEKIHTFENPEIEEFCFSNSMIINQEDFSFYALAYSKYEYKNELKLIKGSLKEPSLVIDDKVIPFNFHDIMSYVDIIYSAQQRKFYAITLFHSDNNTTSVQIYSIMADPALEPATYYEKNNPQPATSYKLYIYLLIVLVLGIITYIIVRKKSVKNTVSETLTFEKDKAIDPNSGQPNTTSPLPKGESNTKTSSEDIVIVPKNDYSISLFGGFQVIDSNEKNITNKFTPLLKELFLLVFLKSCGQSNNGISSDKLKEILWYDKSDKDARNNRAVNIARLKSLLASVGNITVSKSTGYWMIEINDTTLNIDYSSFMEITQKNNHKKEDIIHLMQIIKRGDFLQNVAYDWLDKYKADVSGDIIDVLLNYANDHKNNFDDALIIQIADAILLFDSVNEEALSIKCKSLVKNGKHSIAKKTYDIFLKEYNTLYGEDYSLSFNSIISD